MSITLHAFRDNAGLSQVQLAKVMDRPRTYISKLENGKALPVLGSLPRIAEALGTTVYGLIAVAESIP